MTGIEDHSRFCVLAALMPRERTQRVCDALSAALVRHGCPEQILTNNGKVFTGRFNHPPTEVLFDAICRRNGIEHLLTAPRSPTTTGKIERFHRTIRAELVTGTLFTDLATAQREIDAWVAHDNHDRPHHSLDMAPPPPGSSPTSAASRSRPRTGPARTGSRAKSRPTGWSACPGNRCRSGSTALVNAATCSSGPTPCSKPLTRPERPYRYGSTEVGAVPGKAMMTQVIASLSQGVPAALSELTTLGRTLKKRAADVLAYFERPGTSNGPTEAINGRLEYLRGTALDFRNLTLYIARSLLETGGFRPQLHCRLR